MHGMESEKNRSNGGNTTIVTQLSDYDKDEIEARTVKFVTDLLPSAGA